ncbi:MAG: hypothetical protein ACI9N1_003156 [Flavobacteriales bacterium]|jgi:hypothetical protein
MPYCNNEIIVLDIDKASVIQVIDKIAVAKFKAQKAICLDNGNFNIDGGLNDVRAVISEEVGLIKFCCRYTKDVHRVESLVSDFVYENHNCKLAGKS